MLNIKAITKLTGLTSKTLRHWEKMGLLTPERDLENDYRLYSDTDLTRIFYIMSLRQMDLSLETIRNILLHVTDEETALAEHLTRLKDKKNQLALLIDQLSNKLEKGDYQMKAQDFKLLKKQQIEENEEKYGAEIRERWGSERIDKSNEKYATADEAKIKWWQETHSKVIVMLEQSYETQDTHLAYEAIILHKELIEAFWPENSVSPEAHIGLGQMYVDDERFRANYNKKYDDLPEYFRDAIVSYYGK